MKHIQFCIEEMLAEVEAELASSECGRALTQLVERNARGEPLEAVDGQRLRDHLQRQVDAMPLARARSKIIELQSLLETPAARPAAAEPARTSEDEVAVPAVASTAIVTPAIETRGIISLQRTNPARQVRQKPMHQRLAEAAAGAGIAVVVMSLWAPLTPAFGDLPVAMVALWPGQL